MKTDELAESESKGYADGYAGRIRQRSDDPDEKRWLFYYEPDDEQWNAYQYGQGTGNHKRLIESAIAIQPSKFDDMPSIQERHAEQYAGWAEAPKARKQLSMF